MAAQCRAAAGQRAAISGALRKPPTCGLRAALPCQDDDLEPQRVHGVLGDAGTWTRVDVLGAPLLVQGLNRVQIRLAGIGQGLTPGFVLLAHFGDGSGG